ncbi:MAG TPA: ATP-binding protein [Vicinamibacterales bacterium]|jgi:signal transduction histidine kinase|nr:ATP-binding protein [Vicinamibacterales bacterium]
MRLGIKGKQVLYVTSIVGVFVVVLSGLYLARLAQVSLTASQGSAELLAKTIYQRAREVVVEGRDPYDQLRTDPGLRTILESALYGRNVSYAAIVDTSGAVIAKDPALQETPLRPAEDVDQLLTQGPIAQLMTIYSGQGRNLEERQPLLIGDREVGSIRVGVSTLLIRDELGDSLGPALVVALVALTVAVFIAMLLAQLILRPIHVLQSGLTRLGRGESGVKLELGTDDEFGDLGTFFNTVSAQLSADRSQMAGQVAHLESAVEHLEDAVAIVNPKGDIMFANQAALALFPDAKPGAAMSGLVSEHHPLRRMFEDTLASGQSFGPVSAAFESGERLILGHPVQDESNNLVGIMLIVRNLEYLSQVQSTVRYSRKLAALGRLSAGVAHEVKNPLNAMMIHLELLRQQFVPRPSRLAAAAGSAGGVSEAVMTPAASLKTTDALHHVDVIAGEIRRLDDVVQGFLKFSRPEDLKLQPIQLSELLRDVVPILQPEADRAGVALIVESQNVPDINCDPTMLKQAFLNLGLNACQAMSKGGTLRIRSSAVRGRRVSIEFIDTGVGISQENLQRIFDLYFTTKTKGSGIGLSMVYRTIQMHDGEIEVQSTPGVGTTFRVLLPQA